MVKKTKVIAFRLTEEDYNILQWRAKERGVKIAELVASRIALSVTDSKADYQAFCKKAEAKAKRLAKKESASGL